MLLFCFIITEIKKENRNKTSTFATQTKQMTAGDETALFNFIKLYRQKITTKMELVILHNDETCFVQLHKTKVLSLDGK